MEQGNSAQTLLAYWRIIRDYRRLIVCIVFASVLVTGILSKLSTKLYEAKATILPVREEAMGGGGFSFGTGKDKGGGGSGGGAGMVMDALGGKSTGPTVMDTLNVILESRAIAEAVLDELNLLSYYGVDSKAVGVQILRGELKVKSSPFKALEIIIRTKDPQMAADIANAFCAHLDRLNKGYALASTRRMRRFLELRLVEKSQKLDEAESRLKDFQTDNKIIATAEQTEGAMTAVAELHSQIIAYEVELAALKEYATPHHPMINHLQAQIEESRRQLDKLDQDKALGIVSKRAPLSKKVFPAYGEAPTLALEMLRLARKVKVEEAVYGMLIGQLESVKMTEARDLPTIQVMDPAVPPTYSVYPKTLQNALASGALALILGVFLAYVLQYIEHLKVSAIGSSHPSTSLVGDTNGNGKCDQQDPLPAREMQHPLE